MPVEEKLQEGELRRKTMGRIVLVGCSYQRHALAPEGQSSAQLGVVGRSEATRVDHHHGEWIAALSHSSRQRSMMPRDSSARRMTGVLGKLCAGLLRLVAAVQTARCQSVPRRRSLVVLGNAFASSKSKSTEPSR